MTRPLALEDAKDIVARGGIVAYPTDTVWGIGGLATSFAVAKKIRRIKGSPRSKPFPVVIPEAEYLSKIVAKNWEELSEVIDYFWPGCLTIVVPSEKSELVAAVGRAGKVGVRLPDCIEARELARAANGFLISTSANYMSEPPPRELSRIDTLLLQQLDGWVNSPTAGSGKPSTVIEYRQGKWILLRQGEIPRHMLEQIIELSNV